MSATALQPLRDGVPRRVARKRAIALALPVLLRACLGDVVIAFDIPGLAERARLDNAAMLVADAVSCKARDNRRGTLAVAIEGNRRASHPDDALPG